MSTHDRTSSISPPRSATPRRAGREEASVPVQHSVPGLPHSATALASELERSLAEQPRVGAVHLLVRRDPRAVAGLEAGLRRVLAMDGLSGVRLESRAGAAIPIAPDASVRSLVMAILEDGASLFWVMPSATVDRLTMVSDMAMVAGRMIAHGAHRWQCTPNGAWQRTGAVRSLAQPLMGKPTASPPTSATTREVLISIPIPQRAVVRRTAIDLPALPLLAANLLDRHRQLFQTLSRLDQSGTALEADERAWLGRYAVLLNEAAAADTQAAPSSPTASQLISEPSAEAAKAEPAAEPAPSAAGAPQASAEANQALFNRDRAKISNHDRRKARLHELIAWSTQRPLTIKERQEQRRLHFLVARDDAHQKPIDRMLDDSVERRAHLVAVTRAQVRPEEFRKSQHPIPTKKGAFLVFPRGIDPSDDEAMAQWLMEGYARKRGRVTSPMVDFQITWSQDAAMDREWMAYVIRRVCIAIGRDPNVHVFAASHEPDIHPHSAQDGKPIQPHAHVMVLTCNPDGSTWRCPNLHLVAQIELESLNRERGWGLTSSAVAKGAQKFWYTPKGSAKIGWTVGGVFTPTDGAEATRAAAREFVPSRPQSRPGAGLIVINQQHSPRREALRRQDMLDLAKASAEVNRLLTQAKHQHLPLPQDELGRVRLRYYSGEQRTSGALSPSDQTLADLAYATIRRDAAASRIITKKIDYYSH